MYRLRKADIVVDKLVTQAKKAIASIQLEWAIGNVIRTQVVAMDTLHKAQKCIAFKKAPDGSYMSSCQYRMVTADVHLCINRVLADANFMRSCIPKTEQ